MRETEVLVVGGGVSGLTTSYELGQRGVDSLVVEKGTRAGGLISTKVRDGFVMDPGPDAFLTQKPSALALIEELGLTSRIVPTNPHQKKVYVLWKGRLLPLPAGMRLTVPTRYGPLLTSPLFSLQGKLRLFAERFVARRQPSIVEESIAEFVERRFGREALERVGEPLLAGIHCGDAQKLSMDVLFPRLVELESRFGSLTKGMTKVVRTQGDSMFASLDGGMAVLVESLRSRVPADRLVMGESVERIETSPEGFVARLSGGGSVGARRVVLALPISTCRTLTAPTWPAVSKVLSRISTTSTAVVFHAFDSDAFSHPLDGYGFVVPKSEPNRLLAATFVSTKFPGRAPAGSTLLRTFLGGERDPAALALSDDDLIDLSLDELGKAIGAVPEARFSSVTRWNDRTPHVELGHKEILAALDEARPKGLHILGNGLASIGIPDCIAEARKTAAEISELVCARG